MARADCHKADAEIYGVFLKTAGHPDRNNGQPASQHKSPGIPGICPNDILASPAKVSELSATCGTVIKLFQTYAETPSCFCVDQPSHFANSSRLCTFFAEMFGDFKITSYLCTAFER